MELFGIPSRRKNSEIKYVPTFREGLSFEATYFEVIFPVCFEGLLRAIFSCRTSSKFLKCSRGSEVTVTAGIDHIKGGLACGLGMTVTAGFRPHRQLALW